MAAGDDPKTNPGKTPASPGSDNGVSGNSGGGPGIAELRLRRQTERIREIERLMRAAAAFARGKPGR